MREGGREGGRAGGPLVLASTTRYYRTLLSFTSFPQ
jgi:hypothetical protein